MYKLGFHNNNCFGKSNTSIGGCVQGGIGYWQKIQREYPEKFQKMAEMEHKLTDMKGEPVTMLKDQSAEASTSGNKLVFLKPHPKYPHIKDLSMMEGREPKPLMECNGFCTSNDLEEILLKTKLITINYQCFKINCLILHMQNTIKIDKLVSVMAFAKMKAVSRQTVYNWIKAKQIMSIMIGGKTFVMP